MALYFETVSVDEAIKKGRKTITLPVVMLFVLSFVGGIVIGIETTPLCIPLIWIGGFVITSFYQQYAIIKWKLWAFENVRNVHELRQRAVFAGFFREKDLKDTNLLGPFSIISKTDQAKWQQLQEKFNQPNIFIDDPTIPAETVIYYSKTKNLVLLLFYLPFWGLGIGCFMAGRTDFYMYFFGVLMLVLAFVFTYTTVRNIGNRTAQITINNRGLATIQNGFYPWHEIKNEKTIYERWGKTANIYLTYEHNAGTVKFLMGALTVNRRQLENLLRIYRGRFEAGQKH